MLGNSSLISSCVSIVINESTGMAMTAASVSGTEISTGAEVWSIMFCSSVTDVVIASEVCGTTSVSNSILASPSLHSLATPTSDLTTSSGEISDEIAILLEDVSFNSLQSSMFLSPSSVTDTAALTFSDFDFIRPIYGRKMCTKGKAIMT